MKHLKRFNEEVRADYEQDENRVFSDDMDRLVHFVRDNEEYVLEAIEHWETSHGRDFKGSDFYKWFDDYMLYEGEGEEITEGVTEKAAKRKDKHLEVNPDKMEQMRKKVKDHVESQGCETKQVGDDLEIHLDKKHIAQVMFRKEYIGVKRVGNKFPKELEYTELGKIKSELSDIIKSNK